MTRVLSIDLGGTNVRWCVYEPDNNKLVPGERGSASIQQSLVETLCNLAGRQFDGIGIGAAGLYDPASDRIQLEKYPNGGIALAPIRKFLSGPIEVANDLEAQAYGIGTPAIADSELVFQASHETWTAKPGGTQLYNAGTGLGIVSEFAGRVYPSESGNTPIPMPRDRNTAELFAPVFEALRKTAPLPRLEDIVSGPGTEFLSRHCGCPSPEHPQLRNGWVGSGAPGVEKYLRIFGTLLGLKMQELVLSYTWMPVRRILLAGNVFNGCPELVKNRWVQAAFLATAVHPQLVQQVEVRLCRNADIGLDGPAYMVVKRLGLSDHPFLRSAS